jgi:2-oxoacid:acceptor oxidoreductase gamma subunit (pyruvate/2-ketoisovalerate family)
MLEIRFHGRGGQGAVVASRMLAHAAFLAGNHVQAFPDFGLERRGAPVLAFTRVQDSPILDHSKIYIPDIVVVLDASLMELIDVSEGVKKDGLILVNSGLPPEKLSKIKPSGVLVATVDASRIAAKHGLGSRTQPIVNTAILGALAKATGVVTLENVTVAIRENIAIKTTANIAACKEAYDNVIKPD